MRERVEVAGESESKDAGREVPRITSASMTRPCPCPRACTKADAADSLAGGLLRGHTYTEAFVAGRNSDPCTHGPHAEVFHSFQTFVSRVIHVCKFMGLQVVAFVTTCHYHFGAHLPLQLQNDGADQRQAWYAAAVAWPL